MIASRVLNQIVGGFVLLASGTVAYADAVTSNDTVKQIAEEMPFQKESLVSEGDIIKVIIVLFFMLLLAFVVLFFLKKKFGDPSSQGVNGVFGKKKISVVENKRLTPKTLLSLVEVDDQKVLVAIHKDSVALLKLDDAGVCDGESVFKENDENRTNKAVVGNAPIDASEINQRDTVESDS